MLTFIYIPYIGIYEITLRKYFLFTLFSSLLNLYLIHCVYFLHLYYYYNLIYIFF